MATFITGRDRALGTGCAISGYKDERSQSAAVSREPMRPGTA